MHRVVDCEFYSTSQVKKKSKKSQSQWRSSMSHQIGSLALASHATDLKAEILSRTKPIVIHQIFTK